MLRDLLEYKKFRDEIIIYIKSAFIENKEIEKNLIFLLLGSDLNIIKVGSTVHIKINVNETKKISLYDVNEFSEIKEITLIKKGSILGFCNLPKNPFIIEDLIPELRYQHVYDY